MIHGSENPEFQKVIMNYQSNFFTDNVDKRKAAVLSFACLFRMEKKSIFTFIKKGLPTFLKTLCDEKQPEVVREATAMCFKEI
jgi:hypothetical protein